MRSARSEWIKVLEAGIFAFGLILLALAQYQPSVERLSAPSSSSHTTAVLETSY